MKIIRPSYDPRHLFGTRSVQYLAMLSILITHDTQVGLLTGSTPLGVRQATMGLKRGMRRRRRNPHTMRRLEHKVRIPGDTMMAAEQS